MSLGLCLSFSPYFAPPLVLESYTELNKLVRSRTLKSLTGCISVSRRERETERGVEIANLLLQSAARVLTFGSCSPPATASCQSSPSGSYCTAAAMRVSKGLDGYASHGNLSSCYTVQPLPAQTQGRDRHMHGNTVFHVYQRHHAHIFTRFLKIGYLKMLGEKETMSQGVYAVRYLTTKSLHAGSTQTMLNQMRD